MYQILNGGGYAKHDASFVMNRPRGFDSHVLLITRSKAVFQFQTGDYTTGPHYAILIKAHTPYRYYNPEGGYTDDWLHFTCEKNDLSTIDPQAFHHPFPLGNPSLTESFVLQLLYEKNYAPKALREKHIDTLFRILLDHLLYDLHHPTKNEYSPYLHPMQKLRLAMQSAPQSAGSAKEAASEIGISLSYFQHLYSHFFAISYQKDLIRMKLAYSEELLRTTDLSVEEIAHACGYTNPVHFYRQFRSQYGVTPGAYRLL